MISVGENAWSRADERVGAITPEHAARLRDAARLLATARTGGGDAVRAAGHEMARRGVPLLRLILAAAALGIISIDPGEPDRPVPFTYATLALYTLYSAVVYVAATRDRVLPRKLAHWIDIAWYTLLVSLSSGTNSLFFFFYFFGIVSASFRYGAAEGMRVTAVSTVLFTAVGYAFSPTETFALNKFLLRPICLIVLGYMISYWGGLERRLRKRLTLLREITLLRNPRFGTEETFSLALDKLRHVFDADTCLLVIADAADREYQLYQSVRNGRRIWQSSSNDLASLFLALPITEAVLVDPRSVRRWLGPAVHVEDVVTGQTTSEPSMAAQVVLAGLESEAVATVPVRCHEEAVGRLYVAGRSGTLDVSDLDFLMQAMDTLIRFTENVRLADRLAVDAADNERRRIARGVHHTVIQPYIGLQLGLGAILDRMKKGDRHVEHELEKLLGLIDDEVARMRDYVINLRGIPDPSVTFMDAVRQFAREYQRVTGIVVYVDGPPELTLTGRVATELFEMTSEGLSNVRRHTSAQRAAVGVEQTADAIRLIIENDAPQGGVAEFEPRSLREHAVSLGGDVQVRRDAAATVVSITIPL